MGDAPFGDPSDANPWNLVLQRDPGDRKGSCQSLVEDSVGALTLLVNVEYVRRVDVCEVLPGVVKGVKFPPRERVDHSQLLVVEACHYVLLIRAKSQQTDSEGAAGSVRLNQRDLAHVSDESDAKVHLENLDGALERRVPDDQVSPISAELQVGGVMRSDCESVKTVPLATLAFVKTVEADYVATAT